MDKAGAKFTVYFEEPFWVGIYECEAEGNLEACKITFGAEPKDYEVYEFVLKKTYYLKFTKSICIETVPEKHINPKRMQREIERQVHQTGMGTKAQQALKLQHEQNKLERKTRLRTLNEEEAQRQFELRQAKRKEKHKGH